MLPSSPDGAELGYTTLQFYKHADPQHCECGFRFCNCPQSSNCDGGEIPITCILVSLNKDLAAGASINLVDCMFSLSGSSIINGEMTKNKVERFALMMIQLLWIYQTQL